jgi:hypothetical protein
MPRYSPPGSAAQVERGGQAKLHQMADLARHSVASSCAALNASVRVAVRFMAKSPRRLLVKLAMYPPLCPPLERPPFPGLLPRPAPLPPRCAAARPELRRKHG